MITEITPSLHDRISVLGMGNFFESLRDDPHVAQESYETIIGVDWRRVALCLEGGVPEQSIGPVVALELAYRKSVSGGTVTISVGAD